jgi:hypothetical protein
MFKKFCIFKCFTNKIKNLNQDELNQSHNGILKNTEEENKQYNDEVCINLFDFCYHPNNYSKRVHFNHDYILK